LQFLQAHGYEWKIRYWRGASGREVEFLIGWNRAEMDVIECKWEAKKLEPAAMKVF
jgi:hypothetical protein